MAYAVLTNDVFQTMKTKHQHHEVKKVYLFKHLCIVYTL